jgi:hypothetical protein
VWDAATGKPVIGPLAHGDAVQSALREAFGAAGASVRLVVLNACYSEPAAVALLAHVDCVVGMAGAIVFAICSRFIPATISDSAFSSTTARWARAWRRVDVQPLRADAERELVVSILPPFLRHAPRSPAGQGGLQRDLARLQVRERAAERRRRTGFSRMLVRCPAGIRTAVRWSDGVGR